jgi:hypothetical protein
LVTTDSLSPNKLVRPSIRIPFICVFAYLKKYNCSLLVMDDNMPVRDQTRFKKCDWAEFYPGAAEAITTGAKGNLVHMTCFVDANHAGCQVTRRSHTGITDFHELVTYLAVLDAAEYSCVINIGSEFIAAKTAIEMVEGAILAPRSVWILSY